jgi:hypothetical protein
MAKSGTYSLPLCVKIALRKYLQGSSSFFAPKAQKRRISKRYFLNTILTESGKK